MKLKPILFVVSILLTGCNGSHSNNIQFNNTSDANPVTPPVAPPVTPPITPPVIPPITPPVIPPVIPPAHSELIRNVIVQEKTDDILVNPDRGFQQFAWVHDTDKKSPNYIAASTFYVRFNWAQIEPERGSFDFSVIDDALAQAKANGMKLAFRVMAMEYANDWGTHSALPQYVIDDSRAVKPAGFKYPVPDYSREAFLGDLELLVAKLAERYDDPNEISSVDVGTVGSWGEWNIESSAPFSGELSNNRALFSNFDELKQIPIIYKKYFKKVPIIMLIGNGSDPFLADATLHGTGWRADCFGDYGQKAGDWNHMSAYPKILEQAENWNPNFEDSWKKAPVNFEICYSLDDWDKFGYTREQVKNSFNWALSQHVSSVDFTVGGVPQKYRDLVDSFMKNMGYRIEFETGTFDYFVGDDGKTINIRTTWKNTGSAPTYYGYKLAYEIVGLDGKVISKVVTSHNSNLIMPATQFGDEPESIEFKDSIGVPDHGEYMLKMAFVDDSGKASLSIPTSLKSKNKWYEIGTIIKEQK